MNNYLIKSGRIIDPSQDIDSVGDILVINGVIAEIRTSDSNWNHLGEKLNNEIKIIEAKDNIVSPGFVDAHCHLREPGFEHKETISSGTKAAAKGGYTTVCVMPNTNPPLDTPESIRFIVEKADGLPIHIFPIASITKGQEGLQITEIGELVKAGAVAISDDGFPVQNGQIMRYAVEYARIFNIPVINHAEDLYLQNNGVMNESALSTQLGLPGNPDIAESVMVYRDLEIAEFTRGRIHIPHVSTARSVHLIRKYKKKGLNITAEVTPHHLGLTENKLLQYDTHAKVSPPLRTDKDRKALINGLMDGTIDCIATDHAPHTIEEKEMDFLHTPCGMIGLESAFGLAHTILIKAGANTEQVIQWMREQDKRLISGWKIQLTILRCSQQV